MNEPEDNKPTEQINLVGVGLTVLVILGLAYFVDLGSLKSWVEQAGVWGPLIFILLKISTLVVAPLSGSPLYPIVGVLFGFWPGFAYVLIGDFLGYTATFFISRIFGQKLVRKFISDKEDGALNKVIKHAGTPKGFFHACLTLVAMPELLSYGAGLTKLHYWRFITTLTPITALGSGLFVFIGSTLDTSNQSIFIGFGLPAIGILAMLIGGTLFTKSMNKNQVE